MTFSKEPIIWIGAIVALLMVAQDVLQDNLNWESLNAALVAIGAVIGRNLVSPVARK